MSRIGKSPIQIPSGVTIEVKDLLVKVMGPKGELSQDLKDFIKLEQSEGKLVVSIADAEDSYQRGLWGLTRTLISNMVTGVTNGFEKSLEIIGVGYKFEVASPTKLILSAGFSHKVELTAPEGVTLAVDTNVKNGISIKGIDKQAVGFFAAKVRSVKKPEPYKGKGIRYVGEYVRRKAGKTGGKKK